MIWLLTCAVVAFLVFDAQVLRFAQQAGLKNLPQPLPDEVIRAWEKAGANFQWRTPEGRYTEEAVPGAMPGFALFELESVVLGSLPSPQSAFFIDGESILLDEHLEGITRLSYLAWILGGNRLTRDGLKALSGLKNLAWLDLSQSQITDDDLKELSGLTTLTKLSLTGCPNVTDEGLALLGGLNNLAYLSLDSTQITDNGLKELKGFKNLTSLDLCWTKVTDAGLQELVDLKQMTRLFRGNTKVTDTGVRHLAALINLTAVGLFATEITDAGLEEMAVLRNLEYLNICRTRITDDSVHILSDLKRLTHLCLDNNQLTDKTLHILGENNLLHILSWAYGQDNKQTKRPDDVVSFTIYNSRVSDTGLAHLSRLTNLKELVVTSSQVTESGITVLVSFKQLTTLDLRYATDNDLKAIARLGQLTTLKLLNTEVTDAGLKELAALKNLTWLELNNKQITDLTLKTLNESNLLHALSNAQAYVEKRATSQEDIVVFKLCGTQVTDAGLKELAGLTNLTHLDLRETQVTQAGKEQLRATMRNTAIY